MAEKLQMSTRDYHNPAPAVAVLIEKDGELLFAQRRFKPKKGYWDTPGGFIEAGETAEECVRREIREETTLEVEVETMLGSKDDLYGDEPTINFIYLTKILNGTPQAKDDVATLKWFTPQEILQQKLAFTNTKKAIKLYQQYRKGKNE